MTHNLKQNLPVLTADEYRLGQAHTLYHRQEPAEPEHTLFASYLMVVNMTIGDDYYVPTAYIDEARAEGTAVHLTLTRDDIQNKTLTRTPQFIVDDRYNEEKLAPGESSAAAVPQQGKPIDDNVVPLPPNLQTNPEDKSNPL
ncbi:MAG: hypothetical protein IPM53_28660 [Anaerolineaceae bacterium]|nr:hypothetical protein [Anaerolineaceae bacterium]